MRCWAAVGLGVTWGGGGGEQLSRSFSKDDVEMLLRSVAAEVVFSLIVFLNGLRCVFSPANEKGLKQQSWLSCVNENLSSAKFQKFQDD